LWDLLGKQPGVPVCQLFGSNREQVPIYGSGGWLSYSLDDLLGEVTAYVKRGFTMVKMKVGRADVRQDAERVRAVRNAIGDKVRLMVDANQAWTAQQAISFTRQADDQDIYWFEEPVAKDDLEDIARSRRSATCQLLQASGNTLWTHFESFLREELRPSSSRMSSESAG
jgi:L-alanine-DL-glutamate epimerase-like enolase superfamily enzyme